MKPIKVADLFCGCGGTSTGVAQYAESVGRKLDLVAVNHWDRAVETHAKNHPKANHFCQDLTRLKPGEAVPGGRLDLLVASPECTHHSNARGGKPKNDQSRASAWVVLEWVNALQVDRVLIENVPEFQSWGPIGSNGKALASKKGETFRAFIAALVASGYRVEYKTLNAADYGAATSRRRLFIQAVKGGRRRIVWPEPTHSKDQRDNLFGRLPKWRGAREIIDWNLLGTSIFTRSRPLSANTMARIEAGLKKFGGANAEPFIVAMNYLKERGNDARSVHGLNEPLPTITSQGNRFAFILPHRKFERMDVDDINNPIRTIDATNGRCIALAEGVIVPTNYGEREGQAPRCHSVEEPLPTVVAGGQTHGIARGCMVQLTHGGRELSVDEPLPTVTTAKRGEIGVVQPYLCDMRGTDPKALERTARDVGEPHPTITAGGSHTAIVEPYIVQANHGADKDGGGHERRAQSINDPLGTIMAGGKSHAIVQPYITPYYGTSGPASTEEPLATVTTKDRFALIEPQMNGSEQVAIDILFRMLRPHELKAAMGFDPDYIITGNLGEQVKQIGNAVEVKQARALAGAAFSN